MKPVMLVAVMALVTMFTRFLPFIVFRKETPPYIEYLGKVLPPAIIGMLVVYCLKDVTVITHPYGLPELTASLCAAGVHIWKRNSILSILAGTFSYMLLINGVLF